MPPLRTLIALADHGLGISVTLLVGGTVVSGFLTTAADYWRHFREELLKACQPSTAAGLAQALPVEADSPPGDQPDCVYLRDASLFLSPTDPIPTQGGTYFRVRLDRVDGFTLGSLVIQRNREGG